ncbi:hypothetical protein G6F56_001610 [Rhizopus delemar]|nr:hypothetical protein G6F56_001610 [Rhizopus delemar]
MSTNQDISGQEILFKELVARKYNSIGEIRDAFGKHTLLWLDFPITTIVSTQRTVRLGCVHSDSKREHRKERLHTVEEETESNPYYICSNGVKRPKPRRISKKKECPWNIFASCTKADGNKWTVKMKNSYIDSHNHPIAIDKTIYHAYLRFVKESDENAKMEVKDIYNHRQKYLHLPSSTDEMQKLLEFFAGNNYIARYREDPVTKELKSMFVTTKHSIEKARRFPEVVVIDTTYKMNLNQMPVVNIVGVDNISSEYGSSSLKTFFIATVIVSDEKTITFDWILQILRNEIWSEENMPGVFVTDDDKALGRSLENIFPEVPRTLCTWHIKAKVIAAFAEEEKRKYKMSDDKENTKTNASDVERDKHFVPEKEESVGSVIKAKACTLRKEYHDLDSNGKAIVSLGLNSILDLSYEHPDAQSTLFNNRQWLHLKRTNKPKKYVSTKYTYISEILTPMFKAYNLAKTSDENWNAIYVQCKKLAEQNDPEIDILMAVKHEPGLFSDTVDSSEWDYIMKFWGPITQRLFYFSGLRLKWGDTHLTLHDTIGDMVLKVDLRIIHDSIKQRHNFENEVGVAEAAEENPGSAKFNSDRCKVLIESKAIVDRFILDGCPIDNVDSLQICGMEAYFIKLELQDNGLYIGTQHYHSVVDASLNSLKKYMELAFNLLCFKDRCIEIYNVYENHLLSSRGQQKSTKRPAPQLIDDEISTKQTWIRGTWNPPRTTKTSPPPEPHNLYFKEQ